MAASGGLSPSPATATQVAVIFDRLFLESHRTRLVGGADEPLYLAARADSPAVIRFREDYVSSALHEVAHWCIAGPHRRQIDDYGYWYAPDGRDARQQREFVRVEARPQALEWIFSRACGVTFHVSADNLSGNCNAESEAQLRAAVLAAARDFSKRGLPGRARQFVGALASHFQADQDPLAIFREERARA